MKRNFLLSVMLLVVPGVIGAGVTIHNSTTDILCVAFVKTKADLKSKIGLGKIKKHESMYDDEIQVQKIVPSKKAYFRAYPSGGLSTYDRVLWISSKPNDCQGLESVEKAIDKPAGFVAAEVGSKTNVVIVSAGGGKYQLQPWTKKLEAELQKKRQAMSETLKKMRMKWEDLKNASQAKLNSVKQSFNESYRSLSQKANASYKNLSQKATKTRQRIFGKTKKEIESEVEGEGEQPGSPMDGAGEEGRPGVWASEGFAIDDELGDGGDLYMMQ